MRKLIRHKWDKGICVYCKCERAYNYGANSYSNKYIYSNSVDNNMYRAPNCKRLYLSDKV